MQLVYTDKSYVTTWFRQADLDTLIERRIKSKQKKIESSILFIVACIVIRLLINSGRLDIPAFILISITMLIIVTKVIHDQRFINLAKKDLTTGTQEVTGKIDKKGIFTQKEQLHCLFQSDCTFPTTYYVTLKDHQLQLFTDSLFRQVKDNATVTLTYYPNLRFVKEYTLKHS